MILRPRRPMAGMSTAAAPVRVVSRTVSGFSLVEVLVAIALFGISMSAIAALTLAVTRQSTATVGVVERTNVLEARVNDLFSVPWTAIDARVGCTTINTQPIQRTECITVTNVSATRKLVTLTVTPTDTLVKPATVTVERTMPPATNPFNVKP